MWINFCKLISGLLVLIAIWIYPNGKINDAFFLIGIAIVYAIWENTSVKEGK